VLAQVFITQMGVQPPAKAVLAELPETDLGCEDAVRSRIVSHFAQISPLATVSNSSRPEAWQTRRSSARAT